MLQKKGAVVNWEPSHKKQLTELQIVDFNWTEIMSILVEQLLIDFSRMKIT